MNSSNTLLCTGQIATLIVTGASSYTWSTSSNSSSINVSPTVTTTYTVTGINSFGCLNNSFITQNVSTCAWIHEKSDSEFFDLNIYPNPVSDILNIVCAQSDFTVEILNATGQIIYQSNANNKYLKIVLNEFAAGLYFIQIKNDTGIFKTKIIKQ